MLKSKSIWAVGALTGVLLSAMMAGADDDFTAHYNRYLSHNMRLPARSAGMGGAYTALRGKQQGLLGNPASLAWQEDYYVELDGFLGETSSALTVPDLSGGTGELRSRNADADMWSAGTGLAVPLGWGGVGINYDYREDDVDSATYRFPADYGSYSSDLERHQVSAGIGYKVMDNLAVGYRYSYIDWSQDGNFRVEGPLPPFDIDLGEQEFQGHRNQAGVQYILDDNWTLGLDGYYGFGDIDYGSGDDEDADSWAIRGGVAWNVLPELPLLLALDVNFERIEFDADGDDDQEDVFGVHFGAEYEVYKHLFLRAGYQFEDYDVDNKIVDYADPSVSGYTAGIGYSYSQFSVDYAFLYGDTGREDLWHYVVVGFNF